MLYHYVKCWWQKIPTKIELIPQRRTSIEGEDTLFQNKGEAII